MQRRELFAATAATAAAAMTSPAVAQAPRILRFVPQANLTSLDPIWTTANVTRNHAYMVYDTLYGLDAEFNARPQMASGHSIEDDGKRITITLRAGLRWHDGERVTAADCVQSLVRWMRRNPSGQQLARQLDELVAVDDTSFRFRLKKPFPLLFSALASPVNPAPFMMPERIAATDAFQQIREAIGSGPFKFSSREYNSGSLVVYERNGDYVPNPQGRPSFTAGPKVANFDRIEWRIITDAATATAALQTGEIDWFEQPPPEIQQLLRRNRNITQEPIDPLPLSAILRFNFLHGPFDKKEMRQAILPAVNQADYMSAVVGTDPALIRTGVGVFTPGTPLASDVGLEALTGPRSIDRAKALLRDAGYTNQLIRLIGPTDILAPAAITQVAGDMFRWNVFLTSFSSTDFMDPAGHFPLRGSGANSWPGWPTVPRLEELRDAWFDAPDLDAQKAIARDMQRVAMDEVPFIPVGAYMSVTAHRSNLRDRVPGFALFWNLRRA
ncbi:MAG: ABC transporter substrate-binding protein [Alphaproteobacteria bacterium]|nr:ABC transporter substrate-binding protein [Alphaproteobacteria bacterium]